MLSIFAGDESSHHLGCSPGLQAHCQGRPLPDFKGPAWSIQLHFRKRGHWSPQSVKVLLQHSVPTMLRKRWQRLPREKTLPYYPCFCIGLRKDSDRSQHQTRTWIHKLKLWWHYIYQKSYQTGVKIMRPNRIQYIWK